MNVKRFFSLLIFSMMFNPILFAQSVNVNHENNEEKLYITSGNIQIVDEEFFLYSHGALIPIAKVDKDELGTYVLVNPDFVWEVKCNVCGKTYDRDNQSSRCPHGWILNRPRQ